MQENTRPRCKDQCGHRDNKQKSEEQLYLQQTTPKISLMLDQKQTNGFNQRRDKPR